MSDSINEQRCDHGSTTSHGSSANGDWCYGPRRGPSVVTPPAQNENAVEAAERAIREELHTISDAHVYNVDAIIRRYAERAVAAILTHLLAETVPAAPSVSTDHTDIDNRVGKLRELAESDDYAEFGSETVLALIAEVGQLRGERDELRRDASQGEVEIARLRDAMRRCNAVRHPSVTPESLIPCQLDRDHDGDHYSTSGCSGGAVSWPRAEAERDALQAERDRALASLRVERDAVARLQAEFEELREQTFPKSWAGFKAFIDEVYPDDIFPDDDRDLGPQFVVAARLLAALQARIDAIREARSCLGAGPMDYEAFTDEVDRILAVGAALGVDPQKEEQA